MMRALYTSLPPPAPGTDPLVIAAERAAGRMIAVAHEAAGAERLDEECSRAIAARMLEVLDRVVEEAHRLAAAGHAPAPPVDATPARRSWLARFFGR